jgi:hypothetical protein
MKITYADIKGGFLVFPSPTPNIWNEEWDIFVQVDLDFPPLATNFGWDKRSMQFIGFNGTCDHRHTDGTVECPDCGVGAGWFINSAYEWLLANIETVVDDRGYFDELVAEHRLVQREAQS